MITEDLYLKYAQVINMCEGTGVKPWEGVRQPKTKELPRTDRHPDFTMPPEDYEFMVAVLENKPVFVGDKVYAKLIDKEVIVGNEQDWGKNKEWDHSRFSWAKPKATFAWGNYNDLPCPVRGLEGRYPLTINGESFWFLTEEDRNTVGSAISDILRDATK